MFFFQPAYPDPFDISSAVPTAPAYVNDVLTLSLPVVNQVQVDEKTPICFFKLDPPSRWPGPTSHGWRCTVGNSRLSSWVSMFQRTSQMKSYLAEAENITTHLFFLTSAWMSVRPGCNGAFWRMCVQQEVRRADKVQTRKKISIKHSMLPIMRLAHNMCHRILFVERTWARQFTVDEKRPMNLISTIKLLITHWKI